MSLAGPIRLGDALFEPDGSGALWWPDERTLIVADLHLEKGSHYARHHTLLPPYDTATTLAALAAAIERYQPGLVVALGDSLHDRDGADRLGEAERSQLQGLAAGRRWLWVAGNHDAVGLDRLGIGRIAEEAAIGGIAFRHEAAPTSTLPEISGHFHPNASVTVHGRRLSRRCFLASTDRLILPAFGAYTGGLDVRDDAFRGLFAGAFTAHLIGRDRVVAVGSEQIFGARSLVRGSGIVTRRA